MAEVKKHYDDLLARHYSWTIGIDFYEKVIEQRKLLEEFGFSSGLREVALDLGCGPGYQALALCDLGYETVIAVDTSPTLLDEMAQFADNRPIRPILSDMRDFPKYINKDSVDAIVCMGDTITHLESKSGVLNLLQDAFCVLRSGGRLALTFRDFSVELAGTDRFIPVRSEEERIMLCALLYEPEHVVVNDLVYIRSQGEWTLHKSSYRKYRIDPSWLVGELRTIGFSVDVDATVSRMRAVVAHKR